MKYSLGISNFLEEISSLSHSVLFLYFFALITKEDLSLLAVLWNSAFRCLYLSFSPLLFTSLLFIAICKASPDSHFAFLHFFSMEHLVGVYNYLSLAHTLLNQCVKSLHSCRTSQELWLQPTRLLCPWDSPGNILERVSISSCRGSSPPGDWDWLFYVSCTMSQTSLHSSSSTLSIRSSPLNLFLTSTV